MRIDKGFGFRCVVSALVFGVAGVVLAGCITETPGGGGDASPTLPPVKATANALTPPTPTPMLPVGPGCPADTAICDAAKAVADGIRGGNLADLALVQAALGLSITCPAGDDAAATLPVCEGAVGAARVGFAVTAKRATFLSRGDFVQFVIDATIARQEKLAWPVTAVGCPQGTGGALDCSRWATVALGPPPGYDGSFILLFAMDKQTGARLIGARNALDRASRGGLIDTGHPGTDLPRQMWFIPWDPSKIGP